MALSSDEIWRIAVHEAGHESEGRWCGRAAYRIEWIIEGEASRAQTVFDTFVLLPDWSYALALAGDAPEDVQDALRDCQDRRSRSLEGRLRIGVAGVVAVARLNGGVATIEDLQGDPSCEDDFAQAVDTAHWILGDEAPGGEVEALLARVIADVADDLTSHREEEIGRIAERVAEKRANKASGLIVFDSRERDELIGAIDSKWRAP